MTLYMVFSLGGTTTVFNSQVTVIENSALMELPLTRTDHLRVPIIGSILCGSLDYHDIVHMNVCKTVSSNWYGFHEYSTHALRRIDNWGIFLDSQKYIYRSIEYLADILESEMNTH